LAGDAPPPSRADAFGSRETAARRTLFSSMRDRVRGRDRRASMHSPRSAGRHARANDLQARRAQPRHRRSNSPMTSMKPARCFLRTGRRHAGGVAL